MYKRTTIEEFSKRLSERNPDIMRKITAILFYSRDRAVIDTIYGVIKIRPHIIERALDIPITSAINKKDFWVKRNEYIREDFNNLDYSFCEYTDNNHKVHLVCKLHDYHYTQRPSHHTAGVQGCAHCMTQTIMYTRENIESHKEFLSKVEGILYVLKLSKDEEIFYKVGITSKSRVEYRINQLRQSYNVSVLYTEEKDIVSAFELEQKFLKEFKSYQYTPKVKFTGYTECLTINPLDAYYY